MGSWTVSPIKFTVPVFGAQAAVLDEMSVLIVGGWTDLNTSSPRAYIFK